MIRTAIAILLLSPGLVWGEADLGQQTYLDACAGCHGVTGHGDGPNAALLTVPVPDLTRFAARNRGAFDTLRMVRLIDGTAGLGAHGGPMPMFGGLLVGPSVVIDAPDGSPVTTTEPILAVVRWVESLQEVPGD
ncbi:cytochrome c [Tropicimonas sp. IMCC34043]|uniref:c-type cytochrome n=1 Tax=Tropicimonas sp. IMCC34043 TaxID=2248760 RepID=UPI000E23D06D|nr:cytochrome c [Tropicimonas sp. IMCC34043]